MKFSTQQIQENKRKHKKYLQQKLYTSQNKKGLEKGEGIRNSLSGSVPHFTIPNFKL